MWKRLYWNYATYSCEKRKYLASIMDEWTIDAEAKSNDEETKTISKNFNQKNITCKIQNFYILLAFSLIFIALLIALSIYCYQLQKHYHFTK